MTFREDAEQRFWERIRRHFMAKVAVSDDDLSCWPWTGATLVEGGYGKFTVEGRTYRAHIVSYELHKGPVTPGLLVLHTCDNPPCVRPEHLYLGTHSRNTLDAYQRGRLVQTKAVTLENAALIVALYSTGSFTQDDLAEFFKTSQRAISEIVRGKY